jgi:hypothetical protein
MVEMVDCCRYVCEKRRTASKYHYRKPEEKLAGHSRPSIPLNYWFLAMTLCTGWKYHEIYSFGSWTKSVEQTEEIWSARKKSNRKSKFWGSNVSQIFWVEDEKWGDFLKWWPNIRLWLQKDGLLHVWSTGLWMLLGTTPKFGSQRERDPQQKPKP